MRAPIAALACAAALLGQPAPAQAIVGGAKPETGSAAHHVVLIVGSRGNVCSGVALARDLVLTAAHCVLPGASYKIVERSAGRAVLRDVRSVTRHPEFSMKTLLGSRATPDVALLKLAENLPAEFAPAPLGLRVNISVGESFVLAGYGATVRGDGKTAGTLRSTSLIATGKPGSLQLRLVDPQNKGDKAGLGACTGDSGAPVFDGSTGTLKVIGIVSWSTGPKLTAGCGGLTGVTPIRRYRAWIIETARALGSPLE